MPQPSSTTATYTVVPNWRRRTATHMPTAAAITPTMMNGRVRTSGAVYRKSPTGQTPASCQPLTGWIRLPNFSATVWPSENSPL